jgi:hypothetical protein
MSAFEIAALVAAFAFTVMALVFAGLMWIAWATIREGDDEIPGLPLEEAKAINRKVARAFDDLATLKEALTQDEIVYPIFPANPSPTPRRSASDCHLTIIDGGDAA